MIYYVLFFARDIFKKYVLRPNRERPDILHVARYGNEAGFYFYFETEAGGFLSEQAGMQFVVFMVAILRVLLPVPGGPGGPGGETAIKVKQKHGNLLRPGDWMSPTGRACYLNGRESERPNLNLFPAPPVIWQPRDKLELPHSDLSKHLKLSSPLQPLRSQSSPSI